MTTEDKAAYDRARYQRDKVKMKAQMRANYEAKRTERISQAIRWNQTHPERRQEISWKSWLKTRWNLTPEEFERLWESCNGQCEICGCTLTRGRLSATSAHIDHDHDSGKIRGLLCARCNQGIGLFDELSTQPAKLRQ